MQRAVLLTLLEFEAKHVGAELKRFSERVPPHARRQTWDKNVARGKVVTFYVHVLTREDLGPCETRRTSSGNRCCLWSCSFRSWLRRGNGRRRSARSGGRSWSRSPVHLTSRASTSCWRLSSRTWLRASVRACGPTCGRSGAPAGWRPTIRQQCVEILVGFGVAHAHEHIGEVGGARGHDSVLIDFI